MKGTKKLEASVQCFFGSLTIISRSVSPPLLSSNDSKSCAEVLRLSPSPPPPSLAVSKRCEYSNIIYFYIIFVIRMYMQCNIIGRAKNMSALVRTTNAG